MKMNKITLLTWLLSLIVLSSCMTSKKIIYVKDLQPDTAYNAIEMPALRLQKYDRIQITVSASSPELAAPFNGGVGSFKVGDDGNVSTSVDRLTVNGGYIVDRQGNIDFPVLGKIYVQGKTLEDVRDIIGDELKSKQYINNPTVKVDLLNLHITIMGAVQSQRVLDVPESRITLLEAITKASGLKNTADPQSVIVIREENGKRVKYVNDIESKTIFDSPTYYLQQNDIVYVEPKMAEPTPEESRNRGWLATGMGLVGILISILALSK